MKQPRDEESVYTYICMFESIEKKLSMNLNKADSDSLSIPYWGGLKLRKEFEIKKSEVWIYMILFFFFLFAEEHQSAQSSFPGKKNK